MVLACRSITEIPAAESDPLARRVNAGPSNRTDSTDRILSIGGTNNLARATERNARAKPEYSLKMSWVRLRGERGFHPGGEH